MSVTAIHTERLQREYLESLAQRVRAWRLREGKSYFSMPTSLWDEAVAAARQHGLRQVARDLGLNGDELRRRMGLPASAGAVEAALEEQVQFAELPGVGAALAAALPPTPAQLPAVATADR